MTTPSAITSCPFIGDEVRRAPDVVDGGDDVVVADGAGAAGVGDAGIGRRLLRATREVSLISSAVSPSTGTVIVVLVLLAVIVAVPLVAVEIDARGGRVAAGGVIDGDVGRRGRA